MKISIVTPSFNLKPFISQAIESVRNQSYGYKEHLIFDAQSTDGTIDVLKRYSVELPYLNWVSEPDQGQSDAINKGFRAASGDILAWLNADDYYLSDTFEKVVKFFQDHPEVDILYGDTMYVDQNDNFLRYKRDHRSDFNTLFYYGCYIESTSTFFRRRIIEEENFLNVNYRIAMDYEYYVRLSKHGYKFAHYPEPLGVFRWQGKNASLDHNRAYVEIREIQQKMGLKLPKNPVLERIIFNLLKESHRVKRRALRTLDLISNFRYF